jgi:hypothetical protein
MDYGDPFRRFSPLRIPSFFGVGNRTNVTTAITAWDVSIDWDVESGV